MTFVNSETGAVTVDWVVLTAALVGLGLATMGVVSSGVEDVSGDIDGQLRDESIVAMGFRTDSNLAYGLYGFKIVNQVRYDDAVVEYAGADVATLHADYLAAQASIQEGLDLQGWGPLRARQYHKMGAIAAELRSQGEPLPDGAMLASEVPAAVSEFNSYFD